MHSALNQAPFIPATRCSYRQQSLLSAGDGQQVNLVAGIRDAHISITKAI